MFAEAKECPAVVRPSTLCRVALVTLVAAMTALGLSGAMPRHATTAHGSFNILVFSRTTGFRHDSIPAGIQAIRDLGAANNFTVDATEDDTRFTDANLARYKTVVFLSAT